VFRHYDKTFRISVPQYPAAGRFTLSSKEVTQLLAGRVVVEEKMDGANVGIIRHKQGLHLQKRGSLVGQSEHLQYQRFLAWAMYENFNQLMKLPIGSLVYGEWLYCVHTLFYDKLPSYFLAFDVWDGKRFLDYDERNAFCIKYGLEQVPLVSVGNYEPKELFDLIPKVSNYGSGMSEGIIVKRYNKHGYLRGKLKHPQFDIEFDEHTWDGSKINQLRTI